MHTGTEVTRFSRALVRTPGQSLVHGLSTAALGRANYHLALEQHAAYIAALETCGLEVTVLAADEAHPDAMFVEDIALLMPRCAIITRPGADSRRGETTHLQQTLQDFYQQIETIDPPGTLDAGDIMMVGEHCYIGLSERSNASAARQMIQHLRQYGYDGSTLSVSAGLHLKSSLSYLENNHLLVTNSLRENPSLQHFNQIVLADDCAYSANSVWINDRVLVPAGFSKTSQSIAALGYQVIELDVSEFRKLDGGLSCLSLRF